MPPASPSHLEAVLRRLLIAALPSVGDVDATVAAALRSARRIELPASAPALLAFARVHVAAELSRRVGAYLADAALQDLEDALAALEQSARASPRRAAPTQVAIELPPGSPRSPRRRARMTSQTCARYPEAPPASDVAPRNESATRAREPPRVVLVDPNAMGRAATARALVRAGYDVDAFAALSSDARDALAAAEVAVLVFAADQGLAQATAALTLACPHAALLVCIDTPTTDATAAEQALASAGAPRFAVSLSLREIVNDVARLLAEHPPV